jgi:hypothetical protein
MEETGFSCATRAIAHRETLQRAAWQTWNMSGDQKLKFSRFLDAESRTSGAPGGEMRKRRIGEGEKKREA